MAAKIILLFNHKGGVSKTTTTYNIAWKLTDLGKKVLLVDGDPQCNLTGLVLGDSFDDYYTDARTSELNIKDAVKMAFGGNPQPITAINCFIPENNPNLFVIPGHPNLSEYDPALSLSLNSNNAISTLQNLPGAFYELIRLNCERYEIDYVFIDMNPGLSSINQTFFMSSDAFIIPTNPDPFSVMALKTLKSVLPRWKSWASQSRTIFNDASYPLPEKEMKFIGEIIQRFTLRKGRAARPYHDRIDEIKKYIEEDLVPELNKFSMAYNISQFIDSGKLQNHCLAEISEFGALLQKSHDSKVPVFALTNEQIKETGPVLTQLQSNRRMFDELFTGIAEIIVEIVQ